MKNVLLSTLLLIGASELGAQKKIVVMGSSTAAGTGSSTGDSSWAGRFQSNFRKNNWDGLDTVVYNIAWYGQSTYSQMPSGWVSPVPNRPTIDSNHNVTKALSFSPDVVIINLPSNDVANLYWGVGTYDMSETMNNFRTMASYLSTQGVSAWFTTTQPRDDMDFTKRSMQRMLYDSIINNFGNKVIDFWNPIVTTDGQFRIKPELKADDVHVNNTGHRLFAEQANSKTYFTGQAAPSSTNIFIEAENYSSSFGVQKENCSDLGGGQNVGYIDLNDWMQYSLTASSSASYLISVRVASPFANGKLEIHNSTGAILGTITIPQTGGWQTWQTASTVISLAAGTQSIRIVSKNATNWNINWIKLEPTNSAPPPPPPPPPSAPSNATTRVEAESYSSHFGTQNENTSDVGGGQNVGYIDFGDWMQYTINPSVSGTQNFSFRVATPNSNNAQFTIKNSTGMVVGTVPVPVTGGWQTWTTVTATLNLNSGSQNFRIESTGGGHFNINWFEYGGTSSTPPPPPPPPTPPPASPQKVEAENWSAMLGVQTESTSDAGGGQNVGYVDPNDWMEYSINPSSTGNYQFTFRVASNWTGGQIQVRKPDGTVLATVNVPKTGGWQTWASVQSPIYLNAGTQTIRLVSLNSSGWNLNWFEYVLTGTGSIVRNDEIVMTQSSLALFPNPVRDRVQIRFAHDEKGIALVQLYSVDGRLVKTSRINHGGGQGTYIEDAGNLPSGQYFVTVSLHGQRWTYKMNKQ